MGWFWGSSNNNADLVKDLDPSLRAFLEKESPVKYEPTPTTERPTASVEPQTYRSRVFGPDQDQKSRERSPSAVPPQSLYQDGRYADLWKSYRPLQDIENATKSDQDKLQDVLEGFKERKAQIGRAALENCSLEQMAVHECYKKGSWASLMMLCRTENKAMERCYMMQAKFLKALGYLSVYERSPEEEERIQMHADTLYHRMLEQERLTKEAQEQGLSEPMMELSFEKGIKQIVTGANMDKVDPTTQPTVAQAMAEEMRIRDAFNTQSSGARFNDLDPKLQKRLLDGMKNMSPGEQAIEMRAIEGDFLASQGLSRRLNDVRSEEKKNRMARQEEGRATVGDRVKTIFGW